MKLKKNGIFFLIGAVGYGLFEVIWRGYTHWSMLIAGGICFIGFKTIADKFKNISLLYKCILGSALVTFTELVFGYIFNIFLRQNVWDYSRIPFNWRGQICLLYSVIWGGLSLIFIPLAGNLNKRLKNI